MITELCIHHHNLILENYEPKGILIRSEFSFYPQHLDLSNNRPTFCHQ
jgi:hypothetical protein